MELLNQISDSTLTYLAPLFWAAIGFLLGVAFVTRRLIKSGHRECLIRFHEGQDTGQKPCRLRRKVKENAAL